MSDRSDNGRRGRARGNRAENTVAAELRADGWVVASMRTASGGGDLMATKAGGRGAWVRLVEVKTTAGGPYERFGPAERLAMLRVARKAGASAWLAYHLRGVTRWIASSEWPKQLERPTQETE